MTDNLPVLRALLALGEVASLPHVANAAGITRAQTLEALKRAERRRHVGRSQGRDWVLTAMGARAIEDAP